MKSFNKYIAAALAGLALASCDDFLTVTPEDKFVQDN